MHGARKRSLGGRHERGGFCLRDTWGLAHIIRQQKRCTPQKNLCNINGGRSRRSKMSGRGSFLQ